MNNRQEIGLACGRVKHVRREFYSWTEVHGDRNAVETISSVRADVDLTNKHAHWSVLCLAQHSR